MLFNSIEYLIFFLVICHLGWLVVGLPRLRTWLLLSASYYFYASNNGWLLVLILVSTQIDYLCGLRIEKSTSPHRRRAYLLASMISNLAILAYFKYFNFFSESLVLCVQALGGTLQHEPWSIVLPVGISFYTFQSMSYTFDVYHGNIPAERSWSKFALYVAFFPQLVAGPIVRASDFLPQLQHKPKLDAPAFERSVALIFVGLIKKIVFADGLLASHAEAAFDVGPHVDSFVAMIGLLAFTFQIYFDFSGYSDIAIGCARLLGYHIPENFRFPYSADSFADFWRRWHISLSQWLRDYLYIPLGGNRMPTPWGVYRNILIVMLLGGLWHGAAWNFVIWGLLHAIFLITERMFQTQSETTKNVPFWKILLRRQIVFLGVLATWVVFRAGSMADVKHYLASLTACDLPDVVTLDQVLVLVFMAFCYLHQQLRWSHRILETFVQLPLPVRGFLYAIAATMIMVFSTQGTQAFIYFQF